MSFTLYQVDAFTDTLFSGNPAAVCPVAEFPSDDLMQKVALENNLSETVFFTKNQDKYHIRWFTPTTEVELCGHATLASAFIIFNFIEPNAQELVFDSLSGSLYVKKLANGQIQLNFPAKIAEEIEIMPDLVDVLGATPIAMYRAKDDFLVVYDDENHVLNLQPDLNRMMQLEPRDVIVSSASKSKYDFVSRVFVPKCGIPEDPVTGSAHCILTPYWANALAKNKLFAKQASSRGGELACELEGDRVYLSGHAVLFMTGEMYL